jgi:hypothetical protein
VILRNKSSAGDISTTNFELYDRATVTKTAWYWKKKRNLDQ